jgi:hypothetical protein
MKEENDFLSLRQIMLAVITVIITLIWADSNGISRTLDNFYNKGLPFAICLGLSLFFLERIANYYYNKKINEVNRQHIKQLEGDKP